MTNELQDFDLSKKFIGTVTKSERITPADQDEVRHICLESETGDRNFTDSQDIGVLAEAPPEFGSPIVRRRYSIAGFSENTKKGRAVLEICVRRCFYIDPVNGEEYPGTVSNYLCNLKPGDKVDLIGPFGIAFQPPKDKTAPLLMIGQGTGIAPFRAFLKNIYKNFGDWKGHALLFHGARTGMELLYMNDEKKDLAQYFDKKTFEAINVICPHPYLDDTVPLEEALKKKKQEVWEMLQDSKTHVYLAGLTKMTGQIEAAFIEMAGSREKWEQQKSALTASGRWQEVLY